MQRSVTNAIWTNILNLVEVDNAKLCLFPPNWANICNVSTTTMKGI